MRSHRLLTLALMAIKSGACSVILCAGMPGPLSICFLCLTPQLNSSSWKVCVSFQLSAVIYFWWQREELVIPPLLLESNGRIVNGSKDGSSSGW